MKRNQHGWITVKKGDAPYTLEVEKLVPLGYSEYKAQLNQTQLAQFRWMCEDGLLKQTRPKEEEWYYLAAEDGVEVSSTFSG